MNQHTATDLRPDMYEKHFKLNARVFAGTPAGADIFVSPQTAESLARMKNALAAPDTVIAITGHAGVGKSTLVSRTLHAISGKNAIVRIGDEKLDPDYVLEMLLVELGTAKAPPGTIQKLRFFRQLLDRLATQNSRVFIVIEDTAKTCPETLSELEALTAADTGFSCGANILLMANGSLDDLLGLPLLARLDQRARLRESVRPFTPEELRGYLNHSFRLAGGEFESIFPDGATELLHTFGGGVARTVNKIVESVLTEAAKRKASEVDLELIKRAAMEEFGLVEEPIPELIQDTLPQLEVLKPELAGDEAPQQKEDPPAPSKPTTPPAETSDGTEENKEVPAWDRDPTLAELRPDLDALEQAMAAAQGQGPDSEDDEAPKPDTSNGTADGKPAGVPEITLDDSIQVKVDRAALELRQLEEEQAARRAAKANKSNEHKTNKPTPDQAAAANDANSSKLSPVELQQIAADLAKAKTIEDVDDKLAETLFGDEINFVAAQVIANPPAADPATPPQAPPTNKAAPSTVAAPPAPAIDTSTAPTYANAPSMTQSQRLRTVKALNTGSRRKSAPSVAPIAAKNAASPPPLPATDQPESIEAQISTSVTQSLKTLDEKSIAVADDDAKKNGFFSRFKRS